MFSRWRTALGVRWPKRWRRAAIVLLVLAIGFCTATAYLFIWPTTGMPTQVDAIVVPGGPGDRLAAALNLARQGRARYLALSQAMYIPPHLCGMHIGSAEVICFQPNPVTTQGEAEATARLTRQYGWRSIVLVTTPDQTWRAKLRFQRCYNGETFAVTTPLPRTMWPYEIAYQWAASVKAEIVNRGCLHKPPGLVCT